MFIDFFKNLLKSDNANSISFYKLYQRLRKWNESGAYPYPYDLPDTISFPPDFWKRVVELYNHTKSDGNERAISVFWADGDLILSSVVKGDSKSVTPKNNVRVSYKASRHNGYLLKEVFVDERKYLAKDVYHKNVPRKIEVLYLFNMHTHPPHPMSDGSVYYSFFSLQDLKSLISSRAVITGMIGDRLWLLMRTSKTPALPADFEEREISIESLTTRLSIAVYSGEFNSKLTRHVVSQPESLSPQQQTPIHIPINADL